jgi:hypothetical protein
MTRGLGIGLVGAGRFGAVCVSRRCATTGGAARRSRTVSRRAMALACRVGRAWL